MEKATNSAEPNYTPSFPAVDSREYRAFLQV